MITFLESWNDIFLLLYVGQSLFFLGLTGLLVLHRRHWLVMLLSLELMILGLILSSSFLGGALGYVFPALFLTTAAAESSLGLILMILYFRTYKTLEWTHDDV